MGKSSSFQGLNSVTISLHGSLELLPRYRRLQEIVTIYLRREHAQLCTLESLNPRNNQSDLNAHVWVRRSAPVDSSEVSVVLTHTNCLVMTGAMLDDAEVSEPHIQLANRFRLLSLGGHSYTTVSGWLAPTERRGTPSL